MTVSLGAHLFVWLGVCVGAHKCVGGCVGVQMGVCVFVEVRLGVRARE